VAEEIESLGRKALPVELDVTKADSVTAAITKAATAMGQIDILVNTAGNTLRKATLEYTEADWNYISETHVKGSWLISQAVAKHMIATHVAGSIINVSSAVATRARKNGLAYSVAKAGINQLTRSLALDLVENNIRVNAIAPGWFITDLNRDFVATPAGQALMTRVPLQRTGELKELEGALLLLASDASSYMTGSIIAVDGGYATNSI
jgi:NAD(P)-dependent dehydrogenase (short-subunit alcohol dehydrogenase family)